MPLPPTPSIVPLGFDATRRSAMSTGLVVLILSALLGIQPITTDLYLPALPALTGGFGATMSQAQLTLTGLLLAFGLSQLVWGPVSDRYGRRPVLLSGLIAYIVAAIGSAFAPSMELLIGWRIVQGAAMGAGVMAARAVIRDLYSPADGARMMSRGLSGLAVVACLSAPLGGLLSDLISWRAALLALAVFGVASLVLIMFWFQETIPQKNPRALAFGSLWRNWLMIARNPAFRAYSALSATSYGGLFTFLAASSFVLIQVLQVGKTQYGLLMFSMSLVYMLGTFGCRRMLQHMEVRRCVAIGSAVTLASGLLTAAFALAGLSSGQHGVWYIMVPQYLFMLAHGVHQPCGQSGAVGPFPQAAGAASALNGFVMMLAAFAMGGWLGTHMDGSVFPLTNGMFFWSVLIALSGWTLVQRHGEPRSAARA